MKNYQTMEIDEILKNLNTNLNGLTNEEYINRINKYGLNELPKKKKDSILKIFLMQFLNSIVFIMIIAAIISFFINEITDAIAIIFIILIDAIIGTIQEYKANKSAEALSNMIKVKTKVLRDKKEIKIDSSNITIGDIVLLESGDKVPADARIIECHNLTVDEALLTGESLASSKNNSVCNLTNISDIKNMVYAGCSIITGRAKVVITNIGNNTEIGKIANKVINTETTKSPLSIRMDKFTKQISIIIIIIAILLIISLLMVGTNLDEIFMTVVSLSVSAMPEGLPLALTLALTIGSSRMGRKNVIVKTLNSVESLGSCTIIASDKTGTLTVNEQTAKKILLPNNDIYDITGVSYNTDGKIIGKKENYHNILNIAKAGILNNEAGISYDDDITTYYGDSIDIAFLILGKKSKIKIDNIKKIDMIPYESENKYSAVFYTENNNTYCSIKGSVEVVLNYCNSMLLGDNIVPLDKEMILKQNELLASSGYRVIALAFNKKEDYIKKEEYNDNDLSNLVFLGLVGFIDPVREEVKESIALCKKAHVKVVMITGDHPLTAYKIASDLKIANSKANVTTGIELEEEYNKGLINFDNFVKTKTVFTRVTPLQKLEIVESYKRNFEFVAVTGDGVNDAPAIKSANIGIAMGDGTDVAKEASDMIIIDDNFTSIVSGIEEGRCAYSNIRKVVYMLVSCGMAEILFFTLSILLKQPIPLLAVQLLWLNLVTDGLQDLALSFEKKENDIMNQKPRNPKEPLFDKLLIKEILISGLAIGLIVFIVWYYLINHLHTDIIIARSYVMVLMVFMQNIHVFNCRSETKSIFKIKLFSNIFVPIAVFLSILLQIIVMRIPLLSELLKVRCISIKDMIILFILSLPISIIMELFKIINKKKCRI